MLNPNEKESGKENWPLCRLLISIDRRCQNTNVSAMRAMQLKVNVENTGTLLVIIAKQDFQINE